MDGFPANPPYAQLRGAGISSGPTIAEAEVLKFIRDVVSGFENPKNKSDSAQFASVMADFFNRELPPADKRQKLETDKTYKIDPNRMDLGDVRGACKQIFALLFEGVQPQLSALQTKYGSKFGNDVAESVFSRSNIHLFEKYMNTASSLADKTYTDKSQANSFYSAEEIIKKANRSLEAHPHPKQQVPANPHMATHQPGV